MQPLHSLAIELATEAVKKMGVQMKIYWSTDKVVSVKDKAEAKAEIKRLANDMFRHPVQTDWADEKVIKWCIKNDSRVKLAHTDNIILYGIYVSTQEIRKVYDDLYLMKERYRDVKSKTEEGKKQNQQIDTMYSAQVQNWKKVCTKLFEVWQMPQYKKTYKPEYENLSKNDTAEQAAKETAERNKKNEKK